MIHVVLSERKNIKEAVAKAWTAWNAGHGHGWTAWTAPPAYG